MEKNYQKDIISFIQSIIKTKFSKVNMGYSPNEVDEALDNIFERLTTFIELYDEVSKNNIALKQQIEELETKNKELVENLSISKSKIEKYEKSGYSMHIFNERLSNLEESTNMKNSKSRKE